MAITSPIPWLLSQFGTDPTPGGGRAYEQLLAMQEAAAYMHQRDFEAYKRQKRFEESGACESD